MAGDSVLRMVVFFIALVSSQQTEDDRKYRNFTYAVSDQSVTLIWKKPGIGDTDPPKIILWETEKTMKQRVVYWSLPSQNSLTIKCLQPKTQYFVSLTASENRNSSDTMANAHSFTTADIVPVPVKDFWDEVKDHWTILVIGAVLMLVAILIIAAAVVLCIACLSRRNRCCRNRRKVLLRIDQDRPSNGGNQHGIFGSKLDDDTDQPRYSETPSISSSLPRFHSQPRRPPSDPPPDYPAPLPPVGWNRWSKRALKVLPIPARRWPKKANAAIEEGRQFSNQVTVSDHPVYSNQEFLPSNDLPVYGNIQF